MDKVIHSSVGPLRKGPPSDINDNKLRKRHLNEANINVSIITEV